MADFVVALDETLQASDYPTRAEGAQIVADAEAARDAAITAGSVYATAAAGVDPVTGVAAGEYYTVVSADPRVAFELWRNVGGAATDTGKRIIDKAALDWQLDDAPEGVAWSLADRLGNTAIAVLDDGTTELASLQVTEINGADAAGVALAGDALVDDAPEDIDFAVADRLGNAALCVRSDGTTEAVALEVSGTLNGVEMSDVLEALAPQEYRYGIVSEIAHYLVNGQSLSIGTAAIPPISTSPLTGALRFAGGARPADTADPVARYASLQPLLESSISLPGGANLGETPCYGAAQAALQAITADGLSVEVLTSADGEGGKSIAALLADTSEHFWRVKSSISAGYTLAQAAGKTYQVDAMLWVQGEEDTRTDTPRADYALALGQMQSQTSDYAATVVQQARPTVLVSYQTSSHLHYSKTRPEIALAQLDASCEYRHVYLGTPIYHLQYAADGLHLTNASSKKLGLHLGYIAKLVTVSGEDWKPLSPTAVRRQGVIIDVDFHVPRGNLVIDTTLVAENSNYGLRVLNPDNSEVAISSVTIISAKRLRIVTAAAPLPGARLQYAHHTNNGGTTGPATGARGNLRDQMGDTVVLDPAGQSYAAHNWCVIFEEIME